MFDLGAMLFWTATDEVTSFAILDRYVEADGTFIEMSDNYVFCSTPAQSGLSRCWCRTGETVFLVVGLRHMDDDRVTVTLVWQTIKYKR